MVVQRRWRWLRWRPWLRVVNECDPISLMPVGDRRQRDQVFLVAGADDRAVYAFDPATFAQYVVTCGLFDNPFTREPLSHHDVERLDALLHHHTAESSLADRRDHLELQGRLARERESALRHWEERAEALVDEMLRQVQLSASCRSVLTMDEFLDDCHGVGERLCSLHEYYTVIHSEDGQRAAETLKQWTDAVRRCATPSPTTTTTPKGRHQTPNERHRLLQALCQQLIVHLQSFSYLSHPMAWAGWLASVCVHHALALALSHPTSSLSALLDDAAGVELATGSIPHSGAAAPPSFSSRPSEPPSSPAPSRATA